MELQIIKPGQTGKGILIEEDAGFISPNNDDKNDQWIIENLQFYPLNKVTVYNRWGSLVFEAEPYQNDWNGHFKGTAPNSLPASTYFYVIDTMKKSQDPYTGYIEIQP